MYKYTLLFVREFGKQKYDMSYVRKPAPAYRRTPRAASSRSRSSKVDVADVAKLLSAASIGGYAGSRVGKYTGRAIGRAVGSKKAGGKIGKSIGRTVGSVMPTLMGMGAYEIGEATGPSDNLRMDVAQDVMTVCRTEYIGDVYSGTGTPSVFDGTIYRINPGLDTTNGGIFSWLPQIARAFEEYKLTQCVVEYRPTSGSSTGADTSVGEVIIAGQYRNASEDFVNKQQMLNSMFSTSAAPYQKQYFPVELAKASRPFAWHNVRDAALPANSDIDLSDTMKLTVATQGCPTASQNLGSLYVHYTCEFQKPTVDVSDSNIAGAVAWIAGAADIVTEASPFSSSTSNVNLVSGSTFPMELITASTNVGRVRVPVSFGPVGSIWSIQLSYKGATTALVNAAFGTHNGFTDYASIYAQNQFDGSGSATRFSTFSNAGSTANNYLRVSIVRFDGVTDGSQPYVEFNFASATLPASATDCWVSMTRVNNAAFDDPYV